MSGLAVLGRKELLESIRTRRLPVVVVLFAGLGILSVLTARYLPEILELALGDEAGMIPIPTPTVIDAFAELQQNLAQFGALTAIVLAMGLVSWEKERGTAAFVLTKPASRGAFLGAKVAALGIVLAIACLAAVSVAWVYAAILFEPVPVGAMVVVAGCAWLALMTWGSITFLASTLLRSAAAAAGIGIVALLGLSLLSAIPTVGRWLPAGLDAIALRAVAGAEVQAADVAAAIGGSVAIAAACLGLAWLAFRRQEL